ncbi:hypothetical protein [Streptomyces bobili]
MPETVVHTAGSTTVDHGDEIRKGSYLATDDECYANHLALMWPDARMTEA